MRTVHELGVRGFTLAAIALVCACGTTSGAEKRTKMGADAGDESGSTTDPNTPDASTGPGPGDLDASTPDSGGNPVVVVGGGSDSCTGATDIPLSGANPRVDLVASNVGASHDVDASCSGAQGADVFYKFTVSKRVFVYADTFGATFDTVLFLTSKDCAPITTAPGGGSTCNDDGCGTTQSQLVALLEPGSYRLGMAGKGGAQGTATIHFEWAIAGSGTASPLPKTNSIQEGVTTGSGGNIDGISNDCIAAGPENSYWWARCPSDPAQTMRASTCDGAAFESVIEAQIPKSAPGVPSAYTCNVDGCGLQGTLGVPIPAGAGLGVLSVDGQAGNDVGSYAMTVTYAL